MVSSAATEKPLTSQHHFRFHAPHAHLSAVFGTDSFGTKAEGFARFFGTPTFLIGQTILVAVWIAVNVTNVTQFDVYPFHSAESRLQPAGRIRCPIDPTRSNPPSGP
jgi:uncharacterized membrane protein